MMGSKGEGRDEDEKQHPVRLSDGYWLGDTAVTQTLWQAVTDGNPSEFKDNPNNPVEQVSWNDVDDFIRQLNTRIEGFDAGLPTEAQWEYACRAGTATPFSFGDTITTDQVNYDGNYPYRKNDDKGEFREQTITVKSLPPNSWGLYQMHGNVWEWCADWYDEYPVAEELLVDPRGPESGDFRVLRGGSWFLYAWGCRSARRVWDVPGFAGDGIGFRLSPGH